MCPQPSCCVYTPHTCALPPTHTQTTMRSLQQQLAQHNAQLEAQRRETRAARETLAEAESDMEGVHFEKRQLLAQWKSSLNAIQK